MVVNKLEQIRTLINEADSRNQYHQELDYLDEGKVAFKKDLGNLYREVEKDFMTAVAKAADKHMPSRANKVRLSFSNPYTVYWQGECQDGKKLSIILELHYNHSGNGIVKYFLYKTVRGNKDVEVVEYEPSQLNVIEFGKMFRASRDRWYSEGA